jgi:cystathionine beta-lyase/cystathionine gamma-synthase
MQPTSGFSTRSIHGGTPPDPSTGAILTPIFQSTTFVQRAVGQHQGYTYTRSGNPTVAALERRLGEIEGALPAVSFSSGMAAITCLLLATVEAGDQVLVSDVVYGGTVRLLRQVFAKFGVASALVDTAEPARLAAAITPRTKLVLVESPANPTLKLTDLAATAEIAHRAGALLAVDNTLLTPFLQQPLDLGADVVVHSTTKYLEGHNATVGGALVTRDEALATGFRFFQNAVGFAQAPFDAWLTLQGLKTLPLRMERHCANAERVAHFLEGHPRVAAVAYPFLDSFPQQDLARRQQKLGGGMIAFTLKGGLEEGLRLMASVRLCSLAENLGAVETLITHPASMTHPDVPAEERRRAGLSDGLVRLSVGLEDVDEIIADLEQALAGQVTP